MISHGVNLSDSGLNFLYAFFIFWTLLIVVGIILQFYEMGFRRGHFRERVKELYHQYLDKLEHRSRGHKRQRLQ